MIGPGIHIVVVARHSRSKNGIASLAYDRAFQYTVLSVAADKTSDTDYWIARFRGL